MLHELLANYIPKVPDVFFAQRLVIQFFYEGLFWL